MSLDKLINFDPPLKRLLFDIPKEFPRAFNLLISSTPTGYEPKKAALCLSSIT